MTAVVNSQLNPLANAFIPINSELSASKKAIQYSIESENETKTTWEGRGKLNSNDIRLQMFELAVKLGYHDVLWKNECFSSITSVLNVNVKNLSIPSQTNLCMLGDSQLPMLPECLTNDDQKLVQKSKTDGTPKTIVKEDKCSCPPMFGWIIPPDFIGNPFNFKFECSKNYPHSPTCTEKLESDVDMLDDLDPKISQWTLDQCFQEMKDILTDVYLTISEDSDSVTKWDEKYKTEDCLEVSDSDSDKESNESEDFGTEFTSLTEIEPDLVDDGVHPLLQSGPTAYEDDEDGVENAENILGRSLSPLPEYLDAATFEVDAVCDPPCSYWCEYLPLAAKDAFKKYVLKSGTTDHKECHQRSAIDYRPMFKRSLSADDAPMYGSFSEGLNRASDMESKEMLLLRRQDPLNYFRIQSNTLTKGKHGSCDFRDQQLLASSTKSNMWGKFDGADSLWQPLPECNTVNTHKLNLKKGREAKRQRTVS